MTPSATTRSSSAKASRTRSSRRPPAGASTSSSTRWAARHPDLTLPVLPIWKNNRTLTGYNIGDLSRRDPQTLRRHALSALDLVASGDVRIDVTEEYGLGEGWNRGKVVLQVADLSPSGV